MQVFNSSYASSRIEISQLREELQLRDELVQQLSRELFRLVKDNTQPGLADTEAVKGASSTQEEVRALREQLQGVEQQVSFYQSQLETRNVEVGQLRQTVHDLTERTRLLEQVIQEMPTVYRQKFEARIEPVLEKVKHLQRHNQQLQAELQSVSYRLAVRTRRSQQPELPSFQEAGVGPVRLPNLGRAPVFEGLS